jgi:CoA:oxalate CoA-transferase
VPAGRVLTVPQALDLDQVKGRGLVKTFKAVASLGRDLSVSRAGFKVRGADPDVATPPPTLGEHSDEVLAAAGYTAAEIAGFRQEGAI